MGNRNTYTLTRQLARRLVTEMTHPVGMSRTVWKNVRSVLAEIAEFYPKAWPSQHQLAERLDMNLRSLRRYIAAAVKAGLLVVEADGGAKSKARPYLSRTNRYWLKLSSWREDRLSYEYNHYPYGVVIAATTSQKKTPSSSAPSSAARPAASQNRGNPPRPKGSNVVVMRQWQEDHGRQVGPEPKPVLRSKKKPARPDPERIVGEIDSGKRAKPRKKAPAPQWKRLAEYFAVCWEQMQQETGRHKDTRGLESYNQCRTYIEAHFKNRTEVEVRNMIEDFVIAVRKRDITVKPGQSAWMCFTGAWGRQRHVVKGDPYAAYRKKAES